MQGTSHVPSDQLATRSRACTVREVRWAAGALVLQQPRAACSLQRDLLLLTSLIPTTRLCARHCRAGESSTWEIVPSPGIDICIVV